MIQKVKKGSVDELHYAIRVVKNKLVEHEQFVDTEKKISKRQKRILNRKS